MAEFKTKEIIVRLESNKKGTGIIGKQCGEIVKCKDCSHIVENMVSMHNGRLFIPIDYYYCKDRKEFVSAESFCSWGVRKTDYT